MRSIEADHHRDLGGVGGAKHPLHQIIAQNYERVDADHEKIQENTPKYTMSPERKELFAAWDEAVKARRPTDPRARDNGWLVEYLMRRLWYYPIQFSVEGAITVTISVSVVGLPSEAADVLRNAAFFELQDSQSPDGSTVELQIPLLLIKEQVESDDEEDLDEAEIPPQYSTRNEQRIAMASAAWYLARLGIRDFPVFGLVTCDEKGYLSQAWVSERDEVRSLTNHPEERY